MSLERSEGSQKKTRKIAAAVVVASNLIAGGAALHTADNALENIKGRHAEEQVRGDVSFFG